MNHSNNRIMRSAIVFLAIFHLCGIPVYATHEPEYWYCAALRILENEHYTSLHNRVDRIAFTPPSKDVTLQALIELYEDRRSNAHSDLIHRGLVDLQSNDRYEQVLGILKNPDEAMACRAQQRALVGMIHDWGIRRGKQLELAPIYARCLAVDLDTLAGNDRDTEYQAQWKLLRRYHDVAPYEAIGQASYLTRHILTHVDAHSATAESVSQMARAMRNLQKLCPQACNKLGHQLLSNMYLRMQLTLLSYKFPQEFRMFDYTPLSRNRLPGKKPRGRLKLGHYGNVWHVTDTESADD